MFVFGTVRLLRLSSISAFNNVFMPLFFHVLFLFSVINFVSSKDEAVALQVQKRYEEGSDANDLFSRNRGLGKRLKRQALDEIY